MHRLILPANLLPLLTGLGRVLLVGAFALAVAGLHYWVLKVEFKGLYWSVPLDDAYIHFRYAQQIADGNLFSYQPGDPYTTGCTSPLYVLLLALPFMLGVEGMAIVPVVLMLGAGWLAATILLLLRLGRQLHNPGAGRMAAALWGSCGFVWYCLFCGMETGLYITLLLGLLSLFISWSAGPPRRPSVALLVLAALLPVTRPEGALLLAALLAVVLARGVLRRGDQRRLRPLLWWALTLLPGVAYHGANRALTGTFTTAGAMSKSLLTAPYFEPHQRAVQFATQLFETARAFLSGADPLYFGLLVTVPGLVALVALALREGSRRVAGVHILLALWTAVALLSASLHFIRIARWTRYYLPLFLLVLIGAGFAWTWLARSLQRRWIVAAATVVLVFFQGDGVVRWMKSYHRDVVTIHTKQAATGRAVRHLPRGSRVLVCDAGAIPFLSNRPIFDIVGLTSPIHHNYFRHGAGSRFELFEGLTDQQRPTHVAAYDFCLWPGARGRILSIKHNMLVAPVIEDGAGSGHTPGGKFAGSVVDRLDVADLRSEQAHGYVVWPPGKMQGNRIHRAPLISGGPVVSDGGRLVSEHERFQFSARPGVELTVLARYTAGLDVPLLVELNQTTRLLMLKHSPRGYHQLSFKVPAAQVKAVNTMRVTTREEAPYHSYHYFILQGKPPR